ncbi:glycoside hydrolase family 18 protein [Mixia osmundae IAM 14324]|uniref:GH18 domain-containing protein n=1 Tax=Mixia osmundae (strain CBS 9802 / IAM 14324 / JCM 22182 / KY 12970) TaxID=764103 RepID=G7E5U1_MIXOS|nr:glycoside hydrolase family 18 protein [Mixia osmundae IAM 14324]KEI40647.1 glycoside hydrolase family 18 protein [Mixia osmundae IAM 14324]GAA98201.1 hypothetical protein E5Q_04884 [Mixia osmundae IAM 14324]
MQRLRPLQLLTASRSLTRCVYCSAIVSAARAADPSPRRSSTPLRLLQRNRPARTDSLADVAPPTSLEEASEAVHVPLSDWGPLEVIYESKKDPIYVIMMYVFAVLGAAGLANFADLVRLYMPKMENRNGKLTVTEELASPTARYTAASLTLLVGLTLGGYMLYVPTKQARRILVALPGPEMRALFPAQVSQSTLLRHSAMLIESEASIVPFVPRSLATSPEATPLSAFELIGPLSDKAHPWYPPLPAFSPAAASRQISAGLGLRGTRKAWNVLKEGTWQDKVAFERALLGRASKVDAFPSCTSKLASIVKRRDHFTAGSPASSYTHLTFDTSLFVFEKPAASRSLHSTCRASRTLKMHLVPSLLSLTLLSASALADGQLLQRRNPKANPQPVAENPKKLNHVELLQEGSGLIDQASPLILAAKKKVANPKKAVSKEPVTTTSSAPTATATVRKLLRSAYYPDWSGDQLTPEALDYSKFDYLDFAFAIPDSSFGLYFTQDDSESLLTRLVKNGHANGVKIMVSIGGWTGSKYFSVATQTKANRQVFIRNIKSMMDKYDLDGIDIDWEYPGSSGNSGNIWAADDTDHLYLFLKGLRASIGAAKMISMAVTQQPWTGPNGSPLANISKYAPYLDRVLVMNYDVWSSSSTPGPNAPFSDGCGNSLQPTANEVAAIDQWLGAGFPATHIIMGLPIYGYVSKSSATKLLDKRSRPRLASAAQPIPVVEEDAFEEEEAPVPIRRRLTRRQQFEIGSAEGQARRAHAKRQATSTPTVEYAASATTSGTAATATNTIVICPDNHSGWGCGPKPVNVPTHASNITVKAGNAGDLSAWMGSQIEFNQIVEAQALVQLANGTFVGKSGYDRYWDSCSSTPFLVNKIRNTVVTYDDQQSLAIKAAYAAERKIGGIGCWDIGGDTYSKGYAMMSAINTALGY